MRFIDLNTSCDRVRWIIKCTVTVILLIHEDDLNAERIAFPSDVERFEDGLITLADSGDVFVQK